MMPYFITHHVKLETMEVLGDYHSMKILLLLHEKGTTMRSVVYAIIPSSSNTLKIRLDTLLDNGLIAEREEKFPPKRKWVELTKKGERVAEHLLAIQRILSE